MLPMNFFDNIFIASYRVYLRYNTNPKLTSACLLAAICGEIFFLSLVLFNKAFEIDVIKRMSWTFTTTLALVAIFGVYNYYSDIRIKRLTERFEEKGLTERRLWGWIAVIILLIPGIALPILLTKHTV